MYNNDSIDDLKNYININQQAIYKYEQKIKELIAQNKIYQNQILLKNTLTTIKIITVTKDKGWHDTSLYLSVIDINKDTENIIKIHTSNRIAWRQRKQIFTIIDNYFKVYPDITIMIFYNYPIPKKLKSKYSSITIKEEKEPSSN